MLEELLMAGHWSLDSHTGSCLPVYLKENSKFKFKETVRHSSWRGQKSPQFLITNYASTILSLGIIILFYTPCPVHMVCVCVCVCMCTCTRVQERELSNVQLFVTPWTLALQAPLSTEFSRQENWSRLPLPTTGDLPTQGLNLHLLHSSLCADSLPLSHLGSPSTPNCSQMKGGASFDHFNRCKVINEPREIANIVG